MILWIPIHDLLTVNFRFHSSSEYNIFHFMNSSSLESIFMVLMKVCLPLWDAWIQTPYVWNHMGAKSFVQL